MSLSLVPLTAVSAFTAAVYPPASGTAVLSADVASGEQALLNRTEYLYDLKRPGTTPSYKNQLIWTADPADWGYLSIGNRTQITEAGTGQNNLTCFLDLPNGCALVSVSIAFTPANGHGALPSIMPQAGVFAQNGGDGSIVQIGSTTIDTSADVTAYQLPHGIIVDTGGAVIDRDGHKYVLILEGEGDGGGLNFKPGLVAFSCLATMTITALDPSAA